MANLGHLEGEYVDVLIKEIDHRLQEISSPIRLSSIFFGGGTPGLVSVSSLESIVHALMKHARIEEDVEFSMETTPHAITPEKASAWRNLGVNRLSIGIESLKDSELSAIGRDHSRAQALHGLDIAARVFMNLNVDFMYGLPTQTLDSWSRTLDELVSLIEQYPQIKHVSAYSLELALNSPLLLRFPRHSSSYPDDDSLVQFFNLLLKRLSQAGFVHYEVSNFARPGFMCRHNVNCWRNQPYFAFGVGAHRYVNGVRSANYRSLQRYMRQCTDNEMSESIDDETRMKEGLILGLRMREGINIATFESDYGVDLLKEYRKPIEKLSALGLIEVDDSSLKISDKGVLVSNSILTEFM